MRRGYTILARRFRAAGGEVDLVAARAGAVHFVEVKARREGTGYDPAEAIDDAKRGRVERAAQAFVKRHRLERASRRFEAALVKVVGDDRFEVRFVPF